MKSAGRRLRSKSRAAALACSGENSVRFARLMRLSLRPNQGNRATLVKKRSSVAPEVRPLSRRGSRMDKNGSIAEGRPKRIADALLKLETFLPYRLNVA